MSDLPTTGDAPPERSRVPAPPAPLPPPHPLDNEWYAHVDGQTYGPYSGHQLADFVKEGRIDSSTQVMAIGSETWTRAAEDPRLGELFRTSRKLQSPPPISAAPGSTVVQVTNTVAPPTIVFLDDGSPFGPKSPGLALALSLILCGAGQMYCGRVGRGFLMLFGSLFLWVVMLGWIIWIWSIVDAYSTAKKMNIRYQQRMLAMQPR
jgi:TM2 domain-containing membrane protein YozV